MAGPFAPFADAKSERNFDQLVAELRKMRGFAVLGAGASHVLPDWRRLYDAIAQRASSDGVQLPTNQTGVDLSDLFLNAKKRLGGAWLLHAVQSELATESAIPELYLLVASLERFTGVHTFNYDDFLYRTAAAEGKDAPTYPFHQWDRSSPRFLYLHGRASNAKDTDEIVLCSDQYKRAYHTTSLLPSIIRTYYGMPPVVFLGTSLSDSHFLKVIGELSTSVQYQSGAQGDEFHARMPWYAFLCCDEPDLKSVHEARLQALGIEIIWYECGVNHDALSQALHMISDDNENVTMASRDPSLILRAREARRVAAIAAPTERQIQLALRLLSDREASRAFFATATSPEWLPALESTGYLLPEEPQEVEGGLLATPWAAATYLERMAASMPEEVAAILDGLETENWLALRDVTRVVTQLDSRTFWELRHRLEQWIDLSVHDGLIREVCKRVENATEPQPWQSLLRTIARKLGDDSTARYEAARVGESATRAYIAAATIDPSVARMLVEAIRAIAGKLWKDPGRDASWIAKRDLNKAEGAGMSPGLDWLLATALQTVSTIAADRRAYNKLLRQALKDKWPLVQRVALFELSRSPTARRAVRPTLVESLPRLVQTQAVHHELALLAGAVVQGGSADDKKILAALRSVITEMHAASPISARRWERLISDDPDEDDLYLYSGVEVFSPDSPLDADEYRQRFGHLDDHAFLDPASNPGRYGIEIGWQNDAELLWSTAAEVIHEDNRVGAVLAMTVDDRTVAAGALKVLRTVPHLKLGERENEVIAWVLSLAREGNEAVLHAVLDILLEFARDARLPETAEEQALELMTKYGVSVRSPLPWGSVWRSDSEPDILLRQLNDIAGKAAQVLVDSFLAERSFAVDPRGHLPTWISQFARDHRWDTVESSVALGEVFPFLVNVDRASAEQVATRVLGSSAPDLARQAFWTGLAWRTNPHRPSLVLLASAMRSDIVRIEAFRNTDRSVREKLLAFAAIAWIQNVPGFADLPSLIFRDGDAEAVKLFVQESALVLRNAEAELQNRKPAILSQIVEADQAHSREREHREYTHWLHVAKDIAPGTILIPSLRHIFSTLPASAIHSAFEYLGGIAAQEPRLALELASSYLGRIRDSMELRWDADTIEALLRTVSREMGETPEFTNLVNDLLMSQTFSLEVAESLLNLR